MFVFHLGLSISRPVSHSTQASSSLQLNVPASHVSFPDSRRVSLQGVAVLRAVLPLKFNELLWDVGLCLISPNSYMVLWGPYAAVKCKGAFLGIAGAKCATL